MYMYIYIYIYICIQDGAFGLGIAIYLVALRAAIPRGAMLLGGLIFALTFLDVCLHDLSKIGVNEC